MLENKQTLPPCKIKNASSVKNGAFTIPEQAHAELLSGIIFKIFCPKCCFGSYYCIPLPSYLATGTDLMRILRVWLIVLLCSVLAMPLQASTASQETQQVLQQAVSTTASIPVSLFVQEKNELHQEAILALDKASVALCYALALRLYFPGTYLMPQSTGSTPAHTSNGLYTLLTTGP
jgi:hypothetical protein